MSKAEYVPMEGRREGDELLLDEVYGEGEEASARNNGAAKFQKRKHYLFNSRRHTNLVARIVILAVSVFGLVQLHGVPEGCEHQHCIAEYLRSGNGQVPTFELLRDPCSSQRVKCYTGEAFDYIKNDSVVLENQADYKLITQTFQQYLKYCDCLISIETQTARDDGFCRLETMRTLVFVFGMIAFLFIALTGNSPNKQRFLALSGGHVYFIVLAVVFSSKDFCRSSSYFGKRDLLMSLIIGAEIVMILITGIEASKAFRLRHAGVKEWV